MKDSASTKPIHAKTLWIVVVVVLIAAVAALGWKQRDHPVAVRAGDPDVTSTDAFQPTVEDVAKAPTPVPAGMVWIRGGEFSMGSETACDGLCQMPGLTRDATPIHRVR